MNISRLLLFSIFGCALPAFSQPEIPPANGLPYPLYSPEETARIVGLEPFSFRLRNMSVQTALRVLGRISGVKIKIGLNGSNRTILDKKIDVEVKDVYFLKALDAILKEADAQAEVQNQPYNSTCFIKVYKSSDTQPLSSQPTFQVRATNIAIYSSKSIELGETLQQNQNAVLNVELKPVLDPRIPVIGFPHVQVTRANDDQGLSLQSDEMDKQMQDPQKFSSQVLIRLKAPLPGSQKIARLEGKLIYVIPTKYEIWQVDDAFNTRTPFHDVQSNGEQVSVRLNSIQQTERGIDLKLEVIAPRPKQLGKPFPIPFPIVDMAQNLTLMDAAGQNLYSSVTGSAGDMNKYTLEITASFPPAGVPQFHVPELVQPLSFTLKIPTEFVQTETPFSFTNLPLP